VTVLMEGYRRCLLSRPAQELAPPGLAILTGPHWLPAEVRHLAGKEGASWGPRAFPSTQPRRAPCCSSVAAKKLARRLAPGLLCWP
jgi:hypothetical protein